MKKKKEEKMDKLHNEAIKYICENLSDKTWVSFKEDIFNFYYDNSGQRLHKVELYKGYDVKPIYGMFKITRKLSFTNKEDEGKDGAVLGILDLTKAELISIHPKKVIFDIVTVYFDK